MTGFVNSDVVLQPGAAGFVNAEPFRCVAGYIDDEQLIVSADMRF
jgi:hypothetical protein